MPRRWARCCRLPSTGRSRFGNSCGLGSSSAAGLSAAPVSAARRPTRCAYGRGAFITGMLASWNGGPASRAVVEFVEETVPAGVPIAEDPGPHLLSYAASPVVASEAAWARAESVLTGPRAMSRAAGFQSAGGGACQLCVSAVRSGSLVCTVRRWRWRLAAEVTNQSRLRACPQTGDLVRAVRMTGSSWAGGDDSNVIAMRQAR